MSVSSYSSVGLGMCRLLVMFVTVAGVFAIETCPDAVPVTDFNTTAYMSGTWYEVGRFDNKWESRGDCVTLTHKTVGGRSTFDISTVVDGKRIDLEGVINIDPRKGYIDYVSRIYKDAEGTDKVPVEILMVDYDKYIVVYYCAVLDNDKKHVYAWILSRTKRLDDASSNKIQQFFASAKYLEWSKIIWDHFDEKPCKVN